jgi:hypothetical protein
VAGHRIKDQQLPITQINVEGTGSVFDPAWITPLAIHYELRVVVRDFDSWWVH